VSQVQTRARRRAPAWSGLYATSVLILATQAITSGAGYLFWAATARRCPPEITGLTGSLVSGVSVVTLLTISGLTTGLIPLLSRTASSEHRYTLAASTGFAALTSSFVGALFFLLIMPHLSESLAAASSLDLAAAVVVAVLGTSVGVWADAVSLGMSRGSVMLWRGAAASGFRLLVFLVPGELSLTTLMWAFALATWIANGIAIFMIGGRKLAPRDRRQALSWWQHRNFMLGNHLTSIGGAVGSYVLPLLVLHELGPRDAGYFYPTWLLGGFFLMISPAVSNAYLARAGSSASLMQRLRHAGTAVAALLALPLVVVLGWPALILQFLGPDYPKYATGVLVLLALSAIPDAITNITVAALRVMGKLKRAVLLNLVMSCTGLVIAVPLLDTLGVAGAGAAWLTAQSVGALMAPLLLRTARSRA
jgi:O-antigen/teichoic acid export membrane protein